MRCRRIVSAATLKSQFLDQGVAARIFRGREADDPLNPGQKMCLALDKVAIAIETKQAVEKSCCKNKKDVCPFYDQCGYQRQKAKGVEAWIFASDMIFHKQPAIGKLRALVIDETIGRKHFAASRPTKNGSCHLQA